MTALLLLYCISHVFYILKSVLPVEYQVIYFVVFLILQNFAWIFLYSRREELKIIPFLIGILLIFNLTSRSMPLFDEESKNYFHEAQYISQGHAPYTAETKPLKSFTNKYNFTEYTAVYSPLTQYFFKHSYKLSNANFNSFKNWIIFPSFFMFSFALFWLFKETRGITAEKQSFFLILIHPLITKNILNSANYELLFVALILFSFYFRHWILSCFFLGLSLLVKPIGIFAVLAPLKKIDFKYSFLIPIVSLLIPSIVWILTTWNFNEYLHRQ